MGSISVEGAAVRLTWNDLSAEGTSKAQAVSDAQGLFSLVNTTGKRLYVNVSKDGFYTSRQNRLAFEYANPADDLFAPDPLNPVTFHLRTKGPGVDLITSQLGVKPYLGVPVPLDGTPVSVDLFERKVGSGGQLMISQRKPAYLSWKEAKEWSFRMEIQDGGFVEHSEEFPFEAPESGYVSVVQFKFQADQKEWATSLQKDYYIRVGNPPRYGRLHLETLIEMEGARLTYAINPDGSRYLEPK